MWEQFIVFGQTLIFHCGIKAVSRLQWDAGLLGDWKVGMNACRPIAVVLQYICINIRMLLLTYFYCVIAKSHWMLCRFIIINAVVRKMPVVTRERELFSKNAFKSFISCRAVAAVLDEFSLFVFWLVSKPLPLFFYTHACWCVSRFKEILYVLNSTRTCLFFFPPRFLLPILQRST